MACSQTMSGISLGCESSKGGIKIAYLAPYQEGVFTIDVSTGNVTAIETDVIFYPYEFKKNTGSMTQTFTIDDQNGVRYNDTAINLVFTRFDAEKRAELNALALSDMIGIVVDSNGVRYAIGTEEPVTATAATGETGTAKADGNKVSITLTDSTSLFLPIVPADVNFTIAD